MFTMLDPDDTRRLQDLVTRAFGGDVAALRAAQQIIDRALERVDGAPAGYRTTITLEVLSPEALPDGADLNGIVGEATDGAYSMAVKGWWCAPVYGARLARLTRAQGSDPALFGLDMDGMPLPER